MATNKIDKHDINLTASDVGALPLTGGILSGSIYVNCEGIAELTLRNLITSRFANLFVGGDDGIFYLRNSLDSNNRTALMLYNESLTDINRLLRLQKLTGGTAEYFNVFGEHNKPQGSYTGNGSSTSRRIEVGGLQGDCGVVIMHSSEGSVILTRASGCAFTTSGFENISFSLGHLESDGSIVIASTSQYLNKNGVTYYYRVL